MRDVAQLGSAHGWGSCGRRFKSSRPDVFTIPNLLTMARALGLPVFLYLEADTRRERRGESSGE